MVHVFCLFVFCIMHICNLKAAHQIVKQMEQCTLTDHIFEAHHSIICNSSLSFKNRSEALDCLLLHIQKTELCKVLGQLASTLQESDEEFKGYMQTIHNAFKKHNLPSNAYLIKESLREIRKKHGLSDLPRLIECTLGSLVNVSYHPSGEAEQRELGHRSLSENFIHPQIIGDGYLCGSYATYKDGAWKYRLCVCSDETFEVLWESPLVSDSPFMYTFSEDRLYITYKNLVFQVDKKTGEGFFGTKLPYEGDISFMGISSSKKLCILQGGAISFVGTHKGAEGLSYPIKHPVEKLDVCCMVGDNVVHWPWLSRFFLTYSATVAKNNSKIRNSENTQNPYAFHHAASGNILYFTAQNSDGSYELACYPLDDVHAHCWRYPIGGGLCGDPCISEDGKTIYIVTVDRMVHILQPSAGECSLRKIPLPQEIFGTNLPVIQLALSSDENRLYLLLRNEKTLHAIDTINSTTAKLHLISSIFEGKCPKLVGLSKKGIPIVQLTST